MKSLYNKIYNAVNEGIQKALLIDPEQNDVSINYSYHKIDNYINPLQYEFVDLGLPSGTLWCDYNVGATCEDNNVSSWYGNYYAWGELIPNKLNFNKEYNWENYQEYNWENYEWSDNKGEKLKKYNTDPKKGNVDNLTVLIPNDDIAYIEYTKKYQNSRMAEKIKMPTKEQLEELKNCHNEWVTDYNDIKGLNGRIFTGYNGNYIFIPAAGEIFGSKFYDTGAFCYLWSSSLDSDYPNLAWSIEFKSDGICVDGSSRYHCFPIRGVCL